MLRDSLVCGVNDTYMQQQLLAKKDLTFESARSMLLSMEMAATNVRLRQQGAAAVSIATENPGSAVQKISCREKKTPQHNSTKTNGQCMRCVLRGHAPSSCRFWTAKCHFWGKTGHNRAVCHLRQKTQQQQQTAVKNILEEPLLSSVDE